MLDIDTYLSAPREENITVEIQTNPACSSSVFIDREDKFSYKNQIYQDEYDSSCVSSNLANGDNMSICNSKIANIEFKTHTSKALIIPLALKSK